VRFKTSRFEKEKAKRKKEKRKVFRISLKVE